MDDPSLIDRPTFYCGYCRESYRGSYRCNEPVSR